MSTRPPFDNSVLAKCNALKRAGFWPGEPKLRPRAWLENFEESDRVVAARLLDRFTLLSEKLTDHLLVAAYDAVSDGLLKGPTAPSRDRLTSAVRDAVFTPVMGERPNPTDSGHLLCRKVRQLLGIPESNILTWEQALDAASKGQPIVFVDDFVGSGDQFITYWQREDLDRRSFKSLSSSPSFVATYLTLVATRTGQDRIHSTIPSLALCAGHLLDSDSTVFSTSGDATPDVSSLLDKYAPRLTPSETYIAGNADYLKYGYKRVGLLFGFEHSIPDATLPIFWSRGANSWEPLVERK